MNVTVNAQGVLTTLDTSKAPPVDLIIAYEAGELSEEDVIDLFQHGVDNGWVWSLQGAYGRQAQRLLDYGLCAYPES